MRFTLSFRELETLSTYELKKLYTDLQECLHNHDLTYHEQQALLRIEGTIRLLLARRTSRPYLGF